MRRFATCALLDGFSRDSMWWEKRKTSSTAAFNKITISFSTVYIDMVTLSYLLVTTG
jgi:hypothetical protein